ncbi:dihydrolipoyl dehydrogenase [Paenactinomyces guangxiensis]|uniref:Dihydrolipoyl dehydrogenase n=1 Tax=Paenactinomyces guangxiensis TaxID=1490290 RepID=A0A7W1WP66_9BACL|nr:dihydrolipoyl dehydrogenase [Paenactinomyces guangxiensis]MBH8590598.1 dihydrolipoyl dehydrogenase [Paenactinomyces guangxiensis]
MERLRRNFSQPSSDTSNSRTPCCYRRGGREKVSTVTIIGGGPAGYVAAITAARLGKQVVLIEEAELGGTCLNEGCIPTKSLLESAETYDRIKHASRFGIDLPLDQVHLNWQSVQQYKNNVVKKLVLGIGYLMKKNKVHVVKGKASFLTDQLIRVQTEDGIAEITANQFIIATGAEPIALPFAPFDGEWVIHNRHAIALPEVPSSLLIVGGGVIGCEFASVYSRMGSKVTIVEMADQILPGEDSDLAAILYHQLVKDGVLIHTSTSVQEIDRNDRSVTLAMNGEITKMTADYVLVAIGRKPRVEGLGLDQIGVLYTKQGIQVNEHMQTSIPHMYACGDVVGGIQLAHFAFHEGEVAAENACGKQKKINRRVVPRCIYTWPEIGSVGLTEKKAREIYGDIRIGEFPFAANGKALILGEQTGKVKVIVHPEFNEIIGFSIVGPRATELIGQGSMMLHSEMTVDTMESFIAAHPTLSEALQEAVLSATGLAVHL